MAEDTKTEKEVLPELRVKKEIIPLKPSTLETVDFALFDFLNEDLNAHATTNKGWKKVPVIWAGNERVRQGKDDPERRDLNKTVILPVISIRRLNKSKNQASKGTVYGRTQPTEDHKGGSLVIARRIMQDKTRRFANADSYRKAGAHPGEVGQGQINFPRRNKKIVYETITVPLPAYIQIDYEIKVETEYQQQMNEIVAAFITGTGTTDDFVIRRDGHMYEAFIDSEFPENNNLDDMGEDPRKFETPITIKVYAYLIGGEDNQEEPFAVRRENAVDVKFPRERVVLGDFNEVDRDSKFRP